MADRTAWPVQGEQVAIPTNIVWKITSPSASTNYYILEDSNADFHIEAIKTIVTDDAGSADFDFQLKRTRGGNTVVISTISNVGPTLDTTTLNTACSNCIIEPGDALWIDPSGVTDVNEVKIELDVIVGVKETT